MSATLPFSFGRTRGVGLTVLLVLLSGLPTVALAQEGGGDDRIRAGAGALLTADFKLGPFFMSPSLGSSAGWGSVPNTRNPDDPFRLATGGFVTAAPGIRAVTPMGQNHSLRLGADAGFVWYPDYQASDQRNLSANAGYEYAGPTATLVASGTYSQGYSSRFSPLAIETPPDPSLETDRLIPFTRNAVDASGSVRLSYLLSLSFETFYRTVSYDETFADLRLSRDDRFGFAVGAPLAITTTSTITPRYAYGRANDPDDELVQNSRSDAFGLGYTWTSGGPALLDVRVGYRRIVPDDPAVTAFSGWESSGLWQWTPAERLLVTLSAERMPFLSRYESNLFGIRRGGGAGLTLALNQRLRFSGRFGFYVHDYPEDTIVLDEDGVALGPRHDELRSYSIGANWRPARSHGIDFAIGEAQRISNAPGESNVGLLLTLGYQFVY